MKFELDDYHRNINDEELINDLKRIALELNKNAVTREENDERWQYHSSTYVRRFGSWFNALEKAWLEQTRSSLNIPNEELFKNLEEIWIQLGRQPKYEEIQKPISKYHVGTYVKRYWSWRSTLERFVSYINDEWINELLDFSEEEKREIVSSKHKTSRTINWRLRFIVMKNDNFKCKICGRNPAMDASIVLHVDHIKAWANWGETVLENLQTLCSVCNIWKSDLE